MSKLHYIYVNVTICQNLSKYGNVILISKIMS